MSILKRTLITVLALTAALQVQAVSAASSVQHHSSVVNATVKEPSAVAGEATERVIKLLSTGRHKFAKNPDLFASEVEKIITPVIAFNAIARGVMGKYAHRATAAEIAEFTKVFQQSLIHFYSQAVLTFNANNLTLDKVEPVSAALMEQYRAGKSRSVPVNVTIRSSGQSYLMSYSMEEVSGHWMVRNIIVEGINLGLQLRNQYTEAMNRYRKTSVVTAKWPELMQGANNTAKRGG